MFSRSRWAFVPLTLAGVAGAIPWLLAHFPVIGFALQRGFALVCHQRPDRSLALFGGSVAVCARCLGVYLGATTGALVHVPRRLAMQLMLAAATVNVIDWLAELSGLHGNWMLARFMLGFAIGTTAAMLVFASIDEVKIATQAKAA